MDTTVVIVISALVVVLIAFAAWYFMRRTSSQRLKEQFGPEYDRTVRKLHNEQLAEAELMERKRRVSKYEIVSLSRTDSARYQETWMEVQTRFVDQPETAVGDADRLVREVMEKRGYPVTHFEQAAADLSVDHPAVVENYRSAHRIAERSRSGRADTEELREALVFYRALFQELLEISDSRNAAKERAFKADRPLRGERRA
jgi:FtsZ-interacting cell division protein ZipA